METTFKGKPIKFFLIDRLAAGIPEKEVCNLFRQYFEVTDPDEKLLSMIKGSEKEVEARKKEILKEIERLNLVGIIMKHIKNLDARAETAESTKDLVSILSVLNSFITSLRPKHEEKTSIRIESQTNILNLNTDFIHDLVNDRIIKVQDITRFTKLFGPPKQIPITVEVKGVSRTTEYFSATKNPPTAPKEKSNIIDVENLGNYTGPEKKKEEDEAPDITAFV